MRLSNFNLIGILCLVFISACQNVQMGNEARTSEKIKANLTAGSGGGKVSVVLTNVSNDMLVLLLWSLPYSDGHLEGNIFRVKRCNGFPVRYVGITASRMNPCIESIAFLGAGESIERKADLTAAYDISSDCIEVFYESYVQYGRLKSVDDIKKIETQLKRNSIGKLFTGLEMVVSNKIIVNF